MKKLESQKHDIGTLAWGAFFIWWGITEMIPALPAGTGALGIGLILLGLNAARYFSGIPANRFSITLGILALLWGGLALVGPLLGLPFEIPVFAILLLALGVTVLIGEMMEYRREKLEECDD